MKPKPSRLSLFLPSLRGGGAERVTVSLATAMQSRGLNVDLLVAQAEGPYLESVPDSVRLIDLNASRVLFSVRPLARYLRRERPAACLATLYHPDIVALWACRLARVDTRIIVTCHSTLSSTVAGSQFRQTRFIPFLLKRYFPKADGIIAVSSGVADDLAEQISLPRESVEVVYNPVLTEELYARANQKVDHPWFGQGEPPVILGVGRLTPAKDYPNLIRAFGLVKQQRDARLMILGEGELRPELEALVDELGLNDSVALPGFVDNPYAYMAHASVFALSSFWEGLPTVLIEAVGIGTPVVSTDCKSGPREILDGGKYGILVPVQDSDALASGILDAMESPRRPLPDEVALQYQPDAVVDRYLEIMMGTEASEPYRVLK